MYQSPIGKHPFVWGCRWVSSSGFLCCYWPPVEVKTRLRVAKISDVCLYSRTRRRILGKMCEQEIQGSEIGAA
jgi:hypothetical protein